MSWSTALAQPRNKSPQLKNHLSQQMLLVASALGLV